MKLRSLLVATVGLSIWACQDQKPAETAAAPEAAKAEAPAAAPAAQPAAPAEEPAGAPGTLKVTVAFEGAAPKMEKLDRKQDPYCAKTPMMNESVMVNKNGTLKNTVVRLTKGVKLDKVDVPATSIEIDQTACMYRPRVTSAIEGQKIVLKNGDATLHNIHAYKGANMESLFNQAQPPKAAPLEKTFTDGAEIVTFKCDVHPWMAGYVAFSKHPYHGVTSDDGAVTLANVPSKKYTVETWHEKYGMMSQEVMVEAGKTTEVKITYKADQAAN